MSHFSEYYYNDCCTQITENEAKELLKAHNCLRSGYSQHDLYEENQGVRKVAIVLYRLDNKKWYVPKE